MQIRKTGLLYFKGNQPSRDNTFLSSYDSAKPNYGLSNFAPAERNSPYRTPKRTPAFQFTDPDVGKVNFPTAEHYLHFQQLNRNAKYEMLSEGWADALPREILNGKKDPNSKWYISPDHLDASIKSNGQYDDEKWTAKAQLVQMQINACKYQQSHDFKACIDLAIALGEYFNDGRGAAVIIEDTASLNAGMQPEKKWGTGPKGDGQNLLGINQMAFANLVHSQQQKNQYQSVKTLCQDLDNHSNKEAYQLDRRLKRATREYQNSAVRAALIAARKAFQDALGQPDTSDLYNVVTTVDDIEALATITSKNPENNNKATDNNTAKKPEKINKAKGNNTPEVKKVKFLTLNNGQTPNRTNTCLSFSVDDKNHPLSNYHRADADSPWVDVNRNPLFKFIDPEIGAVYFPTAKHYLMFQLLNANGKRELKDEWTNIPADETNYEDYFKVIGKQRIIADIFSREQELELRERIQMQIIATKYQQSKAFKECIDAAISLGNVFKDEKGAAFIVADMAKGVNDVEFAKLLGTGVKGDGKNKLGNLYTAFANIIASNKELKAQIENSRTDITFDLLMKPAKAAISTTNEQYQASGLKQAFTQVRADLPDAHNLVETQSLDYTKVRRFTLQELSENFQSKDEVPFATEAAIKSRERLFTKRTDSKPAEKAQVISKQGYFNKITINETTEAQAARIFSELKKDLKKNPKKKICLLFAANNKQAMLLHHHKPDQPIPKIGGSGQAYLFAELINLINKEKLYTKICIAPIATSLTGGDNPKNNRVSKDHIDRDLNNILILIQKGWTVYGIPRVGKESEYAIGGGNSTWWMTEKQDDLGGESQNAYLQAKLKKIESQSRSKEPNYNLVVPVEPTILTDIEAHIMKLAAETDSRFFGERRRHKIAVLKAALALIKNEGTLAELNDAKALSPEWDNATGKSKVVRLVEIAIKYAEANGIIESNKSSMVHK